MPNPRHSRANQKNGSTQNPRVNKAGAPQSHVPRHAVPKEGAERPLQHDALSNSHERSRTKHASVKDGRFRLGAHSADIPASSRRQKEIKVKAHAGSKRENQALIKNLSPTSSHIESAAQYARRTHGKTLVEEKRKHSRKKGALIVLGIIIAIAILAGGVGIFAYFKSTDSNLQLPPSNASEALTPVSVDSPYYILCAADLSRPEYKKQSLDACGYIAIRVDERSRTLTMITIPAKLLVLMGDGSYHPIDEAYSIGGDAELIKAASRVLDSDIAHFITTDAEGLAGMVDALGGVSVEIAQEIDDPEAGSEVIFSGERTLSGNSALTYLRATNIKGGFASCAQNRMDFTLDLALGALDSTTLGFASAVSEASKFIYTDMSTSDLLGLGNALRPSSDITVYTCMVPYYEKQSEDGLSVVYDLYSKKWEAMLGQANEGQDPNIYEDSIDDIDKSSATVEVRNGTTTVGAAAKLGDKLSALGYQITNVGNTDDNTIYPETLIVYTSPDYETQARAIINDMGAGRIVNGGDFYSSDANVIAIIGLDWMPVE